MLRHAVGELGAAVPQPVVHLLDALDVVDAEVDALRREQPGMQADPQRQVEVVARDDGDRQRLHGRNPGGGSAAFPHPGKHASAGLAITRRHWPRPRQPRISRPRISPPAGPAAGSARPGCRRRAPPPAAAPRHGPPAASGPGPGPGRCPGCPRVASGAAPDRSPAGSPAPSSSMTMARLSGSAPGAGRSIRRAGSSGRRGRAPGAARPAGRGGRPPAPAARIPAKAAIAAGRSELRGDGGDRFLEQGGERHDCPVARWRGAASAARASLTSSARASSRCAAAAAGPGSASRAKPEAWSSCATMPRQRPRTPAGAGPWRASRAARSRRASTRPCTVSSVASPRTNPIRDIKKAGHGPGF